LSEKEIEDFFRRKSREYCIFSGILKLISLRKREKSFSPKAKQKTLFIDKNVFSLVRTSLDNSEKILVLINISDNNKKLRVSCRECKIEREAVLRDIVSQRKVISKNGHIDILLKPYQIRWIKHKKI